MNALPIARLFGFEIRVHVSWAIILAVIGVTAATQVAVIAPDIGAAGGWVIGAVVAAAFLLSALAHELGHALAARHVGLPGSPVIVYFFGGAATSRLDTARPRDEVLVAAAGPLVSLVAGAALLVVTLIGELAGSGPVHVIGRVALVDRRDEPPARRRQPAAGVPARWRPHRPRARLGPDGRSGPRVADRGFVRTLPRDPLRDRRDRRHPHRGLDRRPDARGLRLVPRFERQHGRAQRRGRRVARWHPRRRCHGPRRDRRPARR